MKFLYEKLTEFKAKFERYDLDFIRKNLNPRFQLRKYQAEALRYFIYYQQELQQQSKPLHLLFHMATGSGKTLIMAALIIYLYKKGYNKFLFIVNNTNIIEKTKHNFLDLNSEKYLFNQNLKIDNHVLRIKKVNNFSQVSDNEINIVFTTIQGLHTTLQNPRENSLTYRDFNSQKIVTMSDEAHHINVLTKKKLNKTEQTHKNNWENTVNRILNSSHRNLLLEFTATVETSNPAIEQKYLDKIIFKYSLKEYREAGYSKDIKLIRSNLTPWQRALQAIIISQYRKQIARENNLAVKPVVLLKSRTIAASENFSEKFQHRLKNLTTREIKNLLEQQKNNPIIMRVLEFLNNKQISLKTFSKKLQAEFSPKYCLEVNSKNDSEEKQLILNSLESKENEYRLIFTVNKLVEGWDVLNLFDIVRLYDKKTNTSRKVTKTTIGEAQLIGRGARYYPFKLQATDNRYVRKFDHKPDHKLRVLEELYYHCSYNPEYIARLKQLLVDEGALAEKEQKTTKVLSKDKQTCKQLTNLSSLKLAPILHCNFDKTADKIILKPQKHKTTQIIDPQTTVNLPVNIVIKAMQRNSFFNFDNLKSIFPRLASQKQFIHSKNFLAAFTIVIKNKKMVNLSQSQKLQIADALLQFVETELGKRL